MNARVSIEPGDPHCAAAAEFMHGLAEEEARTYSDMGPNERDTFDPAQVLAPRGAFLVARLDGQLVGCGALRPLSAESAEIKRIYVIPSARRQGVGRAMMVELERLAVESGYRVVRLETGNRQPAAIALYQHRGFRRIPLYGEYFGDQVSICFEKELATDANGAALVAKSLFLREVRDEDLPIFFEQQSDAAAIYMVAFAARDPADRGAFTAKWNKIRRNDTTTARTIVVNDKVVGNVLSFISPTSGEREIGYWIGKEHWGQGIATQALAEFLTHADRTRPLFAVVAKDNLRSLRVLAKCGFTIIREAKEFAPARGAVIDELVLEVRTPERAEKPRS